MISIGVVTEGGWKERLTPTPEKPNLTIVVGRGRQKTRCRCQGSLGLLCYYERDKKRTGQRTSIEMAPVTAAFKGKRK